MNTTPTFTDPFAERDHVDRLMDDFTANLAQAAQLHPIAIPLTDSSVLAGEHAPEVIKRRIHRRSKAIQFAISRAKIRCENAGVR